MNYIDMLVVVGVTCRAGDSLKQIYFKQTLTK